MPISFTLVWGISFVLFVVFEAVTAGLVTIWFAGGALFALIAAYFELSPFVQISVFLVSSTVLLISTRPLIKRYIDKNKGIEKTNVDAFIGRKGIVLNKISEFETGLVKISGSTWTAVSDGTFETINVGDEVVVIAVSGVKLIVKKN